MQGLRLSGKVQSVILLQQNASGEVNPVQLFKTNKKKKKKSRSTMGLRLLEKVVEQGIDAEREMVNSYRKSFRNSSRKKRDGWIIDFGPNVFKACRDGARTIRLERII